MRDRRVPLNGGPDAGIDGSGYCALGRTGPRCELCANSSQYVSKGACTSCPNAHSRTWAAVGIALSIVGVFFGFTTACGRYLPQASQFVLSQREYLKARLSALAFVPKAKLVIGICQIAQAVPTVYGLRLPGYYYDWLRFLKIFRVDWQGAIYPFACISGGFETWLLLRALMPLVLVFIVIAWHVISAVVVYSRRHEKGSLPWRKIFLGALPLLLFIAFCLTPSTSESIFAAWSCETFLLDSTARPPTTIKYLIGDLSVVCDTSNPEYKRIVLLASWLVALCES